MGVYIPVANLTVELGDRILETTQTTGTGTYSLDGVSADGRQSFLSGIGNGNKTIYVAELGTSWEIGIGTVTSGAPVTLSRDYIWKSTNSDNAVSWSAGVKSIYCDAASFLLTQISSPGRELWCGAAGGTANAITLTTTEDVGVYINGLQIRFTVTTANTDDDVTVNLNSGGAVALEKAVGTKVGFGSLVAGKVIEAVYVSTTPSFVVTAGLTEDPLFPRGYIDGFRFSNAADADHDITIATGQALSGDGTANIRLNSSITKRIDATWAVGTNQGGLDTGTVQASTFYYLHAIKRLDTAVVDVLFSASKTSPTLPANYTVSRYLGAVVTDGSANILAFSHRGDQWWLTDPVRDVNENITTTAETKTLTAPPDTWAVINFTVQNTGVEEAGIYISPTFVSNEAVSDSVAPLASTYDFHSLSSGTIDAVTQGGTMAIRVDSSSQVRIRCLNSSTVSVATLGWIDPRGKDA